MALTNWNDRNRSLMMNDPFLDDEFFTRPWGEMSIMPRNMRHMMNNSMTRDLMPLMSTDLIESDKTYSVHVDLPGVNPEDLDISIQDDCLCMKAERKYEHEENRDRVHSMERSYGKVQRKIRLPKNCDMDSAVTNMKHGVLTVTFNKKGGMKEDGSRRLAIQFEK